MSGIATLGFPHQIYIYIFLISFTIQRFLGINIIYDCFNIFSANKYKEMPCVEVVHTFIQFII